MVLDRILAFGFVEASDLLKHSKAQRWARNKLPFLYSPGLGMVLFKMDWSFLYQLTIKKCPIDNAPTGQYRSNSLIEVPSSQVTLHLCQADSRQLKLTMTLFKKY